ncbi:MAG: hypothetical protein IJF84_13300 [Thermoguttaceae bacterium]|nr:hypothetical protein [Thermoguttaceae bacterium]
MAAVRFFTGTQSQFDVKKAGGNLIAGALYYISDSRTIYRATGTNTAEVYGAPFKVVEEFPEQNQEQGTLYVKAATYEARTWSGSTWATIALPVTTALSNASTDSQVPTAKAVYDAIDALPKTGTSEGNVPVLDSGGKLVNSVMPALSITEYAGTVSTKNALTTLTTAEKGDYAIVNGDGANDGCYILNGTYSTVTDWIRISAAVNPVTVDNAITENGANPVTGGAIYNALAAKADAATLATVATTGDYNDLTNKMEWESVGESGD